MDKIKEIILYIEELKNEQKFNDAIKLLENSLIKYNQDYRLYEELADIYLFQWELKKGLKSVNFALSINPESATWNYLKWFILLSQDEVRDAVICLEKSNKVLSNNSEVLRNLGWAYSMLWNTQRGITILKRALAITPNDNLIIEDLAMALIWAWEVNEWNSLLKQIGKTVVT